VQVSRVMPFKLATRKDESKSRHDRQMSWIELRKQQSYDNEATKAVKRHLPQMTKIALILVTTSVLSSASSYKTPKRASSSNMRSR
jgi:hypothetical protein